MTGGNNGFQNKVNRNPAPAAKGDFADANIRAVVIAVGAALYAASSPNHPIVGNFAWADQTNGIASGGYYGDASWKLGFVHRETQALIVPFLAPAELAIDAGQPTTLYDQGSFWTLFPLGANVGDKVFANYVDGSVYAAPAGTSTTDDTVTASLASTGILTVTATSGAIVVGDVISGSGVPAGVRVTAFLSGTGGNGTYQTTGTTVVTSRTMTAAHSVETNFHVDSPAFVPAVFTGDIAATGILHVASVASGVVAIGQRLTGTGVPTNARIIGQVDSTHWLTDITSGGVTTSTTITGTQGQLAKISSWS